MLPLIRSPVVIGRYRGIALPTRRLFSQTNACRYTTADESEALAEGKTHYDTLGLPFGAGGTEIKRRFYELSKAHHPDRNPGDPTASSKFVEISNAYHVLSSPIKRAAYDKNLQSYRPHTSPLDPSSYGPVGGRPASGLSRRRTKGQGPPPSYFRDQSYAGWRTKGGAAAASHAGSGSDGYNWAHGFGPGDYTPWRTDDVPHFSWEEKYKQHYDFEQRRQRAARAARSGRSDEFRHSGFWLQALTVGGSVLLVGVLGGLIAGRRDRNRQRPSTEGE